MAVFLFQLGLGGLPAQLAVKFQRAGEAAEIAALEARKLVEDGNECGLFPCRSHAVGGVSDFRVDAGEGEVEQVGFDAVDAAKRPMGDGHAGDGRGLGRSFGMTVVEELVQEVVEVLLGLVFQDDAVGIEAVGDAVAGGAAFSLGCFGASGERPVGS